jgi:hypothetical protein
MSSHLSGQEISKDLPVTTRVLIVLGNQVCRPSPSTTSLRISLNLVCSLLLLHQFLPFFVICLEILGNPTCESLVENIMLVSWVCDHVEVIVQGRAVLKPIAIVMRALVNACNQTKVDSGFLAASVVASSTVTRT